MIPAKEGAYRGGQYNIHSKHYVAKLKPCLILTQTDCITCYVFISLSEHKGWQL